ncbi:hypothetical protein Bpfe_027114 [Biomphalaria pfeifferi]|uniref:Uncharacterized protein n=1 Tax=Biomphalaria pfeifferi TaxID=112525 RepID=A0AAD8EXD4_BIOPF|nr:hypothetical protein Bpfe_027114 [Biomphalaria pfeifferi]
MDNKAVRKGNDIGQMHAGSLTQRRRATLKKSKEQEIDGSTVEGNAELRQLSDNDFSSIDSAGHSRESSLQHSDSGQGDSLLNSDSPLKNLLPDQERSLTHSDSSLGSSVERSESGQEPSLQHSDSGQGKSLLHSLSNQGKSLQRSDSSQEQSLQHSDSGQGKSLLHSLSNQGKSLQSSDSSQEKSLRHSDSGQGKSLLHSLSNQGKSLQRSDSSQEKSLQHSDSGHGKSLLHSLSIQKQNLTEPVDRPLDNPDSGMECTSVYPNQTNFRFPPSTEEMISLPLQRFLDLLSIQYKHNSQTMPSLAYVRHNSWAGPTYCGSLKQKERHLSEEMSCDGINLELGHQSVFKESTKSQLRQQIESSVCLGDKAETHHVAQPLSGGGRTSLTQHHPKTPILSSFDNNNGLTDTHLSTISWTKNYLSDTKSYDIGSPLISIASVSTNGAYHIPSPPGISRANFDQLTKELLKAKEDKNTLEEDVSRLKKLNEDLKMKNYFLESNLKISQQEIEKNQETMDKQSQEIDRLLLEQQMLTNKVTDQNNLNVELKSLKEKVLELQSQLNAERAAKRKGELSNQKLQAECIKLKTKIDLLNDYLERQFIDEGQRLQLSEEPQQEFGLPLRYREPSLEETNLKQVFSSVEVASSNGTSATPYSQPSSHEENTEDEMNSLNVVHRKNSEFH